MAVKKKSNNIGTIPQNEGSTSLNFMLPDKKVTLLPIVRQKSFMGSTNHDGLFLYTGAFNAWTIYRNQHGNYVDPLNYKEREYLEKELKEDFNVYHKDNFWKNYSFKIKKNNSEMSSLKRVFNLSNPHDFIAYKLLLTAPNVANSIKEKDDTPEYTWMLVEQGDTIQTNLKKGKIKAACYAWLTENENKKSYLRDMLYVMNLRTNKDQTLEEVVNIVIDAIESQRVYNLYELINDEDITLKILLAKSLRARAIVIRRNKFYDVNGDLLANNRLSMLEWLSSPENGIGVLEIKKLIEKSKI